MSKSHIIDVCRFELRATKEHLAEYRREWRQMTGLCQQVTNAVWRHWLAWHYANGSPQKLRDYYAIPYDVRKAEKTPIDVPSPKYFTTSIPGGSIYVRIGKEYPELSSQSLGIICKRVLETDINKITAAHGSIFRLAPDPDGQVRNLTKVFNDPAFRADLQLADDFKAAEYLDGFLSKLPVGILPFLKLHAIYGMFPRREEWVGATLQGLYDAYEEARAAQEESQPRQSQRRSVKLAEYQEAVKDREHFEYVATKTLAEADKLRARVAELEQQVIEREARIAELQWLLSRFMPKQEAA